VSINKLPGQYSDVFFYVPIIGNETDELTYELFSVMLALLQQATEIENA